MTSGASETEICQEGGNHSRVQLTACRRSIYRWLVVKACVLHMSRLDPNSRFVETDIWLK